MVDTVRLMIERDGLGIKIYAVDGNGKFINGFSVSSHNVSFKNFKKNLGWLIKEAQVAVSVVTKQAVSIASTVARQVAPYAGLIGAVGFLGSLPGARAEYIKDYACETNTNKNFVANYSICFSGESENRIAISSEGMINDSTAQAIIDAIQQAASAGSCDMLGAKTPCDDTYDYVVQFNFGAETSNLSRSLQFSTSCNGPASSYLVSGSGECVFENILNPILRTLRPTLPPLPSTLPPTLPPVPTTVAPTTWISDITMPPATEAAGIDSALMLRILLPLFGFIVLVMGVIAWRKGWFGGRDVLRDEERAPLRGAAIKPVAPQGPVSMTDISVDDVDGPTVRSDEVDGRPASVAEYRLRVG